MQVDPSPDRTGNGGPFTGATKNFWRPISPGHETADDHKPDAGGNGDGGKRAQRQHLDLVFRLRVHLALHRICRRTNARTCRMVAG